MTRARYLSLIAVMLLLCSACGPRYGIFQATVSDASKTEEGVVQSQDSLTLTVFELWSEGGSPWVSIQNISNDTLFLDLRKSRLYLEPYVVLFDDPQRESIDGLSMQERFANARITYQKLTPLAEIRPGEWIGFVLPPLAWSSCRISRKYHCAKLDLSFRQNNGQVHSSSTEFSGSFSESIKNKHFNSYATLNAEPDRYYVDRRIDRNQRMETAAITFFDVLFLLL